MRVFLGIINTDLFEALLPKIFEDLDKYEKIGESQDQLGQKAILNPSIKSVGFQNFDSILNLGGIFVMLMGFGVLFSVFMILWIFSKMSSFFGFKAKPIT